MITLKQIEALYWVGMLGSFSAAANKLNIAQSTISKRIQEIEDSLQTTFFERDKRSGRLTMKGAEVMPIAEEMLRLQMRMREAVSDNSTYSGTFRCGITELIAITWLPKLFAGIKSAYPELTLEPQVDNLSNLVGRLKDRQIDLLIGPVVTGDDQLTTVSLGAVEQAWMCSPKLYRGPCDIPLAKLAEFPLLQQTAGSGLQLMVSRLLRENGVKVKSVITCNGMVALAKLAKSGFGVTCLPKSKFAPEVKSGKLQVLNTTPAIPPLEFAAAYRRDSVEGLSKSIAALAAEASDFGAWPTADTAPAHAGRRKRGADAMVKNVRR